MWRRAWMFVVLAAGTFAAGIPLATSAHADTWSKSRHMKVSRGCCVPGSLSGCGVRTVRSLEATRISLLRYVFGVSSVDLGATPGVVLGHHETARPATRYLLSAVCDHHVFRLRWTGRSHASLRSGRSASRGFRVGPDANRASFAQDLSEAGSFKHRVRRVG
jgi:hypothetical protein